MSDEKCPSCNHRPHSGLCGRSDGFTPSGCRCVYVPAPADSEGGTETKRPDEIIDLGPIYEQDSNGNNVLCEETAKRVEALGGIDHIAIEKDVFKDGRPYWAFTLFIGDVHAGVGSADTLEMCWSMACEMKADVEAGKLWQGVKRSVASVEGQRTGERSEAEWNRVFIERARIIIEWGNKHGLPNMGDSLRDSFMRFWAYLSEEKRVPVLTSSVPDVEGTQCACCSAMLTELVEFTKCPENEDVVEHIKKLLSPVEGMGAREPESLREETRDLADRILINYGRDLPESKSYKLRIEVIGMWIEILAEAYARSLRGATEQELSDQDRVIEDRNRDIIDLMACVWKPFYARPDLEGRCASCQHYAESYKEFLTIVPHSKHCKFRKLIESSNRGDGSLRGAGGGGETCEDCVIWRRIYNEKLAQLVASESREQALERKVEELEKERKSNG